MEQPVQPRDYSLGRSRTFMRVAVSTAAAFLVIGILTAINDIKT